jgi:hypothetical protein
MLSGKSAAFFDAQKEMALDLACRAVKGHFCSVLVSNIVG